MHHKMPGHVDLLGGFQRLFVLPLAIVIVDESEVQPTGVVRVELHDLPNHRASPFPFAGIGDQVADHAHIARVSRIERQHSIGGHKEGSPLLAEVMSFRQ